MTDNSHASSSSPPFSLTPTSQSLIPHLTPFRFHSPSSRLEPYLPLPSSTLPFPLILTTPRLADTPSKLAVLNDPRVSNELTGPPFPYLEEHEVEWSQGKWRDTKKVFEGWERTISAHQEQQQGEKGERELVLEKPRMGLPFQCIRKEDGEWIGEIGVIRHGYLDVEDLEERERLKKENDEREVGDEELVWCFGCELSFSQTVLFFRLSLTLSADGFALSLSDTSRLSRSSISWSRYHDIRLDFVD